MTSNTISQYLNLVNLQIAAEAFLVEDDKDGGFNPEVQHRPASHPIHSRAGMAKIAFQNKQNA
ncbi:hypothetical protein AGMMS49960_08010 [Betaproteobacteria bacterium]|nr:hypothetical protein AGMMS49543_28110 [Betaproteobacteria bacterium]GHU00311.1 hypothetical protein AGMMS49960_08010 [Betaproteobacteria bacterium]GHU23302.1 hypothetical protein AGMMS50243_24470 [Betaproteobacteria bacterium]